MSEGIDITMSGRVLDDDGFMTNDLSSTASSNSNSNIIIPAQNPANPPPPQTQQGQSGQGQNTPQNQIVPGQGQQGPAPAPVPGQGQQGSTSAPAPETPVPASATQNQMFSQPVQTVVTSRVGGTFKGIPWIE